MSLDYAILGFLNYRPYSGYDLKKIFDKFVRHFWPADQSQIYRTLARMNEKGLVETEVIRQGSRPDRKEYHITSLDCDELRQWLDQLLPIHQHLHLLLLVEHNFLQQEFQQVQLLHLRHNLD